MIGKIISHYHIIEKIGEGGMGEVYLAEDLKLERKVAIKFLPQHLTKNKENVERFEREAKSAASLNHPNIVTIYEIAEEDDPDSAGKQTFIVMEYVEGKTLREMINTPLYPPPGSSPGQALIGGISDLSIVPNSEFPIPNFIDIISQIAEGLSKAHQAGIIHRDIKPENILIDSDGRVKILDFGLAKLKGAGNLTKETSTLGTVNYMSPEQAKGEKVDQRTDIWSLGVMMYEMLCGERPFKGDYEQAVIYSILNEEVKPLTGTRSEVTVEFERIVNKCLAKDPAKRYQHVDDLLVDLRRAADSLTSSVKSGKENGTTGSGKHSVFARVVGIAAVTVVAAILLVFVYPRFFGSSHRDVESDVKKLAVLFFENLGSPDDEYFANGITDAITARLAVIHGLGVISRQSTIQYKDSEKSIQDIGDELGADYILEGTIQRERPGDPTSRVRIIPQLISVSDDIHLWADTYDEDMTEVFRVQSSIAERVAHALNVALLETEREALEAIPTKSLEAYEYYLRGYEYFYRRYSPENSVMAVQMYERATELDFGFAAAWAGLSKAYIWAFYSAYDPRPDLKTAAKDAVDTARELDPASPDVQMALGYYYYYGSHDFDRALEHLEIARRSRPNNVETLNTIAFIKRRKGKWDECAALLEKTADLNPRSFDSVLELGMTYVTMRQYDKAERLLDRAIFLEPEDPMGYIFKILLYLLIDGDTVRAKKTLLEASEVVEPARLGVEMQPFVHIRTLSETYAELLSRVLPERYGSVDTTVFHLGLAEMYYHLGQEEQARRYWKKELVHLESAKSPVFQYDLELCLGLAYAGLGRNEEAIRLARNVLKDAPLSVDAFLGTFRLEMAALIFVRTGAYEEAIDQLELLLSVPSETSPALFRLDPAWDPLRDNPRFQKLVEDQ